jgi:hypothetical protein
MKKRAAKILVGSSVILSTIFSTTVKAQDGESEYGIKGGVNFSNFYSNEVDDQNLRIGYNAGLFFKAAITDFLAIQPEVLYTTKGSTTSYDNFFTGPAKFSQNLNYLEVPVLAVINLGESFNVHAGPYVAYLLKAQVQNKTSDGNLDFVEDLNEGDYERLDYGIAVGAGFEFDVIRFGARYDYGLRQIGKNQGFNLAGVPINSVSFSDLKNSTASLYIGLSF